MTDPSGTLTRWDAKAIGAGSEGAQTELQEHYHKVRCYLLSFSIICNRSSSSSIIKNLALKDAETLALKVLKHVMEEKLSSTNIQVASVTTAKGFRIYSEQELQQVISSL
jgi:20S proteasome subunit alpha 5